MRGRFIDSPFTSQALAPGYTARRCSAQRCQASTDSTAQSVRREKKNRNNRLQLTPEERNAPKPDIIDQAEESLQDYCLALPEDDNQAEQCWEAYEYFEERKEASVATCSIEEVEGVRGGPGCGDRDRFQDFVRNMFGYASVKNFVGTLSTLAHMQNREGQAATKPPSEAEPGEVIGIPDGGRDKLVSLFESMDKDGNGKLDTGEFRDAMAQLQGYLSGEMVSTIFSNMGIHGYITLEQFLDIAEVEGQVAHTPLNAWLQRSARSTLASSMPSSML